MGSLPLRSLGPSLLLAVAVVAALGGSLSGGFVWDDRPLIVENRLVQQPSELGRVLVSSFWETGDHHDRFRSFFRPLVSLSYALDWAVWDANPFGFHLTNLLLHFLCSWLVMRVALAEGLARGPALAGALIFAVHPVHVESVAWISGRTDVLSTALLLGAFLVWRKSRHGTPTSMSRVAALGLFGLALFAKEMAATLPLLLFCDRGLSAPRGARLRSGLVAAMPFLIVLAAYLAVRFSVLDGPGGAIYRLDPEAWIATAFFVVARYLTLLLMPVGLDAHYPYEPLASLTEPLALIGAAMIGVALLACRGLGRTSPRSLFWAAWIAVTLLPVLAFGRFGDVVMADRFTYLPSVGLALLCAHGLAWLLAQRFGGFRRHAVAATLVGIALAFTLASVSRSRVWRDDHALFSDMVRTSPDSALVQANLGLALYRRGEIARAIEASRHALARVPDFAMARNNLAAALERQGRYDEALTQYRQALRTAPDHLEARINAASLSVRVGQVESGLDELREIVRRFPRNSGGLFALGHALELTGRPDEALAHAGRALRADPRHAGANYLVGKIEAERGRYVEAAAAMQRFLELWPDDDRHARAAREILARAAREAAGTRPAASF